MIGFRGRVRTIRPVALDRVDQAVLVRVRGFLAIGSLGLEIRLKLGSIPVLVRGSNFFIPIALHKILEIFAVCGCRVRDIVV